MKNAALHLACVILICGLSAMDSKALATEDGLDTLYDDLEMTPNLLALFFAPAGPGSRILFVDGECGRDSWTGRQWVCAGPNGPKRTIQAAVNKAVSGDIVIVLPATYFEHVTVQNKDLIIAGIPHRTILDGAGTDRVLHIVNSQTSLFGLTVQNGSAMSIDPPAGGGVFCDNSNVVILKSTIRDNAAFDSGGGVFSLNSGITMVRCNVTDNSVVGGPSAGGAGLRGGDSGSSLIDCLFERNEITGVGDGAAILLFDGLIRNCVINDNHIVFEAHLIGGGGLAGCTGPVVGCTISNNSVEFGDGGGASECSGPFTRCIITGNRAFSGIGDVVPVSGGGLARCSGAIVDCLIANNVTENTDDVTPAVESRGGGLAACSGAIVNCTIVRNRAVENTSGSCGGGLFNCTGAIANCIVWANEAVDDAQVCDSNTPNFSCIQDWPGGGVGNIADDPLFVDLNTDRRLAFGSPCIDAGDNDAVPSEITTDLAGSARFFDNPRTADTGNGTPPIVDMGAYEHFTVCGDSAHPYPPMDFNHDCLVDYADFALFSEHWLDCTL